MRGWLKLGDAKTSMTRPLARILIADAFDIVRRGVRNLVADQSYFHVVAEASDGREALRLAVETNPTIAILDYALPQLCGIEVTCQIRRLSPQTQVLFYTDFGCENIILEALQAGARGFVLKSEPAKELAAALDALSLRQPYFSDIVSEVMLDRFLQSKMETSEAVLTRREREIVQLIAEGRINKEIATLLGLSTKTVESHRASAMHKLKLKTTADLVRYAIKSNIILP